MGERLVYVNGELVNESQATVSIYDRGFMLADAAFDVARTFAHCPFKLERHIQRLYSSLRYLAIDPGLSPDDMARLAREVLDINLPLLGGDDEYWITMRVTRGLNPPFYSDATSWNAPTILVYCSPISFTTFAPYYRTGMHLVTPSVRRTPPQCLDPQAKTHERLNLIVGHLEIAKVDPRALPLLLDLNGNVTEAFTANVFFVRDGQLWTPSTRTVLAGITRETVIELARDLRIPVQERDLTLYDVYNADEAFLTATSFVVMPIALINGRDIGTRLPGPVTQAMIDAFGAQVGVNIVEQALRHTAPLNSVNRSEHGA